MGGSWNGGTPKSSIWVGFSVINHPFWGTPMTMETPIYVHPTWLQRHLPGGRSRLELIRNGSDSRRSTAQGGRMYRNQQKRMLGFLCKSQFLLGKIGTQVLKWQAQVYQDPFILYLQVIIVCSYDSTHWPSNSKSRSIQSTWVKQDWDAKHFEKVSFDDQMPNWKIIQGLTSFGTWSRALLGPLLSPHLRWGFPQSFSQQFDSSLTQVDLIWPN